MSSRITLVLPPISIFPSMYPLGLGYLAAILKQNNHDVELLNYSKTSYSLDKSIREIINIKPDFVGLTVYTFSYNVVKKMIANIKEVIPETKIIIGGPHVSALPKFSLEDMKADFAIVGEGEYATLEIIRRLESNFYYFDDIKGLAFWKNGVLVLNPGCNLIDDLDNLPFPSWELMPPSMYNYAAIEVTPKRFPAAPILTSRGCPHECVFCGSHLIHGRGFRKRSAQNVVDEMEFLKRNYGVKEINLFDDTFSEDRRHAMSICEEMIKRNLDIVWRPLVGLRLDTLDNELLDIFKASGCYQLDVGIESFSSNTLKKIKKPINRDCIIDRIRMIKNHGISTSGYFIIGLPEDTEESIRETIKFARASDLNFLLFTHAIPFPGTEIFNWKYKASDLSSFDWDNFYFFTNRPFNISKIPSQKLRNLFLAAYVFSYLTPRRIINILRNFINNFFRKAYILRAFKMAYYIGKNPF